MRFKSLIGICALALVLTAVFSGTAHATSWIVLNGEGKALETLKAAIQSEAENNKISLLTHFLGAALEFRCSTAALVGASLEAEGKITSGFKAKFTGCLLYINGSLASECTPRSSGKAAGTIETNALKGLLVLSEVTGPIKVEPKEGTSFVTIQLAETCAFFENVTINGVLYLQDGQYLLSKHQSSHLVEEAFGTELWILSKTAEHLLTQIDGSANVSLTGEHSGLKWGAPEDLAHKPTWLVLEEKGGEPLKKLNATVQVKNAESTVSLLTKMLGMKVQIRCSGSELSGASFEPEGRTTGFKSKFTGCELLNAESGKGIEECVPRTKGMSAGVVETLELKAEISGENVKITPVGGIFAQLDWGSGCLLASQIPVSGVFYLKDAEGKFGEHLVSHSTIQASGTKLWIGQESVEHLETSIDGGESVALAGVHSGLKWSGMP